MLEAYTVLGFLAARTQRVRLGVMVTTVTFRPPSLLIKAVTSLDVLSGGRAWLGIGAGYNNAEAQAMDLPPPPTAERFERLKETLRLARHVWSGAETPFEGCTTAVGQASSPVVGDVGLCGSWMPEPGRRGNQPGWRPEGEALMTSPTAQFLEDLGRRGYVKSFENVQGRLRLDLTGDGGSDTWLVVVDTGKVQVSPGSQDADCAIRAERAFFDRVASGEANALSALLRGLIQVEGDLQLALVLGRALPGPPHSRWRGHRAARTTRGRRR